MKKILLAVLSLMLCVALMLSAVSCTQVHPIQKFLLKMQSSKSYQISVTMEDIPFLGSISLTTKVDGDIQYIPETLINEEAYFQVSSDAQYLYTKNAKGEWTKTKTELDVDVSEFYRNENILKLLDPDSYEAVEGKENVFKLKDDATFDGFDEITITVKDESCTISAKTNLEGFEISVVIVVSEIGKVKLTLPEVK